MDSLTAIDALRSLGLEGLLLVAGIAMIVGLWTLVPFVILAAVRKGEARIELLAGEIRVLQERVNEEWGPAKRAHDQGSPAAFALAPDRLRAASARRARGATPRALG